MNRNPSIGRPVAGFLFALLLVISFSGCLPLIDRLIYTARGPDTPAAYKGLAGKRTAIVTISDSSAFGPDSLTNSISRMVGARLLAKVRKIDLVPRPIIENWIDENGWDGQDFLSLGEGVKAERVVAIEISNYGIHEGKTLHKGRANIRMLVYELGGKSGPKLAHSFNLNEYEYPRNGRPAIQSSDRQFEEFFLARVSRLLTNQFIPHDRFDDFADDAIMAY